MRDDLSKAAAALLLLLTIARGLIYVLLIPPWQTPDEPSHFGYVRFVTQNHCLPAFERIPVSDEILASMSRASFWRLRYRSLRPEFLAESTEARVATIHPPLYYLLGTLLLIPLKCEDIIHQLYVLRLASVLMGALTVLVAFRTARILFPDDLVLPLAISSFIAFLPMHSFISASVNNDNLAGLVVSLLIYLLMKMLRDGMSPLKGLALTVLLGAAYFTKRTTFYAIPLVVIAVPIYLLTRTSSITDSWLVARRRLRDLPSRARSIGAVTMGRGKLLKVISIMVFVGLMGGALCVLFTGQMEVRRDDAALWGQATPTQQPNVPLLGKQQDPSRPACLDITLPQILKFARISPAYIEKAFSPDDRGASATSSYVLLSLLTFASFWANFGWMNIALDPAWYAILAAISLGAFLGLALRIVREISSSGEQILFRERWQKGAFLVLLLSALLIFVQTCSLMVIQNIPQQGRYLFPAIVPLATLFILGLREFIPSSYRHGFLPMCIFSLFLFDALCLTHYILPYFYG